MGLFDLPAPVLTWLDARFAMALPAVGRLLLWSVVGGALTMSGLKKLQHIDPVPRQTIETLQENKQWLREQVSR